MREIKKKTKKMSEVEARIGENLEEYLRRRYVDDNASQKMLSAELEIAYPMVYRWLKLAGIYSRKVKVR